MLIWDFTTKKERKEDNFQVYASKLSSRISIVNLRFSQGYHYSAFKLASDVPYVMCAYVAWMYEVTSQRKETTHIIHCRFMFSVLFFLEGWKISSNILLCNNSHHLYLETFLIFNIDFFSDFFFNNAHKGTYKLNFSQKKTTTTTTFSLAK